MGKKDFESSYAEKIIPIFLGYSTAYINENFESKILKYRNVIEDRGELEKEHTSESTIMEYIKENDAFRRRCLEHGERFFEIDKNYEEEIKKVYDYIEHQKQKIGFTSTFFDAD